MSPILRIVLTFLPDRSRNIHTPPQTPPYHGTLNGHSQHGHIMPKNGSMQMGGSMGGMPMGGGPNGMEQKPLPGPPTLHAGVGYQHHPSIHLNQCHRVLPISSNFCHPLLFPHCTDRCASEQWNNAIGWLSTASPSIVLNCSKILESSFFTCHDNNPHQHTDQRYGHIGTLNRGMGHGHSAGPHTLGPQGFMNPGHGGTLGRPPKPQNSGYTVQ